MSDEVLTAEVVAVRFKGDDFAVLVAVTDDGDEVTLTGALAQLSPGESVEVRGGFREHAKHGRQFHVDRVRLVEPVGDDALIGYLSSVKHVGTKGAAMLVAEHGAEVLDALDRDPEAVLRTVPGIGAGRIAAAVRSWRDLAGQRALRLFLEQHDVPAAVAARVHRALGDDALARLQQDPYALTEVDGIGFATADALALALGTPPEADGRLDAGLLHALAEAERDGHTLLPRADLLARARKLLDADAEDRVDVLVARGDLEVTEDGRVADARMAARERRIARKVRELLDDEPAFALDGVERVAGTESSHAPTDAQWGAVTAALEHRLSILTGLPGTGKTATMQHLVDVLKAAKRDVKLCAPTGKAARRLSETTGAEATTIHRLLEWQPGEGFTRDRHNPIEGTDVLIVDEASMLGIHLAAALLDAVGPRTHVLLVGDVDQLPPVGPGRVLEDLIDSGAVPTTRLTEIFRQAARSMVIRAAHAINRGESPPTTPSEGDLHDFFFIARTGAQAIFDEVVELAAARLPTHYDLQTVGEVQVLAPMHKGPVGIDALNTELRGRLNPEGRPIPGTPFREGDRVLQTVNNYELELMNGELGVLLSVDADRDRVLLGCDDGRRVRVPLRDLPDLRLAHAISVHKAQGSQMPVVVFPLFGGHAHMLTRNLVYTALTRATTAAVFVGEPQALARAIGRRDAARRFTRLSELVAA